MHVVDSGRGSRSGRRGATCFDDRRAALLHGGDKVVFVPVALNQIERSFAVDFALSQIRVLGGTVVAPDDHVFNVGDVLTGFLCQLGQGAVVIQTRHGGELTCVQIRRVAGSNQRVGVGRVTDDQHFYITAGVIVQCFTLNGEDRCVGFQQVFTLHAWATRTGANQQGEISVFERDVRIISGNDVLYQREGTVVNFHYHAVQGVHCLGNFQKLENDRLIRPQHVASGDAENKRVADLTGAAGNRNTYWIFHHCSLIGSPRDGSRLRSGLTELKTQRWYAQPTKNSIRHAARLCRKLPVLDNTVLIITSCAGPIKTLIYR